MQTLIHIAAVLSACSAILQAQPQPPASSATLEVRSVALPAYRSNPRIAQFVASADDYAKQVKDPSFVMQRLTYRSDGLQVFAYLYRPTNLPTDRRLPVVIFNRGSYVRDDFSYEVLAVANQLAHEGYVTIAPMLRGSGGAAGVDEMGGADLHDIFNVLPVVRELPYTDSSRFFMYGESRGGIMTLMAVRDGFPARAVAVWGAITDLAAYAQKDPGVRELGAKIWPGYPRQ